MWNQVEEGDAELARALEESLRYYNEIELPRTQEYNKVNNKEPPKTGLQENDLFAQPSTSNQSNCAQQIPPKQTFIDEDSSSKNVTSQEKQHIYEGEEAEGFDLQAGKTWLYPTNYPVREYQRSIVETALFHNTLVSLPTGLGKTFIAAVVMYNFYKWYPKGKVIFMAPTKPLVAQQVEQCYNTMGIPRKDTAEMTGALPSKDRGALWRGKRVFFLTPQVVQNDLSSGICPATSVKCVVIDEAHRATGEYAYCQVVKLLQSFGGKFRVLALSATPGSDITAVQKVVSSLMISHIEIRNEDSPDLAPYTHERKIEIMSVSVGPIIIQIREKYLRIMGEYCRKLQTSKVLFGNIASLSSFQILKSWNEFKSNPPPGMSVDVARVLSADFSLLHTLAHGLDLLQNYGLRLLLTNLTDVLEDSSNPNGCRLKRNDELLALLEEIRCILDPPLDNTLAPSQPDFIYGHPKLDALKDVVESHFKDFAARGVQTRVIVFCEYREAVIEIRQLLTALEPLVKPVSFMGQASGKHGKGISQKNQLLVMEKFRKGAFNTLVSTSVGEEGLDIGEVDLIICYDAKNSPIRQVQRMGRTGRKRKGRIIVLVTEGKEEMKFRSALAKKKNINAMLVEQDSLKGYILDESPSMLPEGFQTECVERKVEIAPNTAPLQQQDLRKMFSRKTSNSAGGNTATNVTKPVAEKSYDAEELNQMLPKALEDITKAEDYYNNLNLSRYLEWQRYLQYTHEVDHSTSSEIMRDLMSAALGCQENNLQGLQTQISATQIWPGIKKRGPKRPATSDGRERGKRKIPRTTSERKPGRPASPSSSSDSNEECPIPSSFQAKPARLNQPLILPTSMDVPELPDDDIPLEADVPQDQVLSPEEIYDSDETDLDPEIAAALKKLGIAYCKDDDDSVTEDDNCPVCSQLENSQELKLMINEAKPEPISWIKMEEMLNKVQLILPRVTAKSFSLPISPESPVFVSLIPREEDFNSGLICGGVGDVSLSPIKESEIVSNSNTPQINHLCGSVNSKDDSAESLLDESKEHHSDVSDHLGDGALLHLPLDDVFAKIEETSGNLRSSEDLLTSPILGSQLVRKPRASQVTPISVNPKKRLFPPAQQPNPKQSPKATSSEASSDPINSEASKDRNIELDFESFLQFSSPEEDKELHQDRSNLTPKTEEKMKQYQANDNTSSPVLSKSQPRSKNNRIEFCPEEKSKRLNDLSPALFKDSPKNTKNDQTKKEFEALFDKSDDDMFAGLDIEFEESINVSKVQKLDLDKGFINTPKLNSPKKKVTPPSAKDVDLSELVWLSKSDPIVYPLNKKPSKLSLSKKKNSKQTSCKKPKNEEKSPKHVPDCFQPKKLVFTSESVSKPQFEEPALKPGSKNKVRLSSDDDNFTWIKSDLQLSPIAKSERPVTPNWALDELIQNLSTVSPDRTPEYSRPKSPDNRKRLLSSSPSPEMPRKKQNLQVQSSPESPLFVKPKKGFRRPLDDTVVDLPGTSGWLQAKDDSRNVASKSPAVRRVRLSESSVEEFVERKDRNAEKSKERHKKTKEKPKKRKKKKKSSRFAFLESQAVESDEDLRNSSDDESTSLDELDSSFIDDMPGDSDEADSIDIHAKYLQAVRSPAVKPNAFKIPHPSAIPYQGDVYSQAVDLNDYSSYLNDSFCVDEETDVHSDAEMSLLEVAEARLKAAKKERRKRKDKTPKKTKKRSRIVRPRDSSESDDDIQIIETKIDKLKPVETKTKPVETKTKPVETKAKPVETKAKPVETKTKPVETRTKPVETRTKPVETKTKPVETKAKPVEMDTDLVDPWYDDDFDVPEINDLVPAQSSANKSTSKSRSSYFDSTSKSEQAPVQRTNTDDINQLLDDDFDFSNVAEDIPNDFVENKTKKKGPEDGPSTSRNDPLVIFVSVRQVASASEILRLLRISYKITLSCRSTTDADYVISRRLGVCRIAISDLKSNEKMGPIVKRLKESFAIPILIVENDKENRLLMATKNFKNKGNPSPKKNSQSEWTSTAITTITHLRQASVKILFSDDKPITARLLADLTQRERAAGFSIPPIPQEFTNEMEKKLKFLTTIPGINIALAVNLVMKFKTIKNFITHCSKVTDVQKNVGVNLEAAQKIHNILYQVHMS